MPKREWSIYSGDKRIGTVIVPVSMSVVPHIIRDGATLYVLTDNGYRVAEVADTVKDFDGSWLLVSEYQQKGCADT